MTREGGVSGTYKTNRYDFEYKLASLNVDRTRNR